LVPDTAADPSIVYFDGTYGTIQPVRLTHRGIGPVGDAPQPVNLALAGTATASSRRDPWQRDLPVDTEPNKHGRRVRVHLSRTFEAKNAIDGSNGTRWLPAPGDSAPWREVDLGAAKPVARVEMSFTEPTFGHAWMLEKSSDGEHWESCGEQKEPAARSPDVAEKIGMARFLRVRILGGNPGLWEFKVF